MKISNKIIIVSSLTIVPLVVILIKDFFYFRKGWSTPEIQYQAIFWLLRLLLSPLVVFFAWKCRNTFNKLTSYIFLQIGGFLIYSCIFLSAAFLLGKYWMESFDGRDLNLFITIKQMSSTTNLLVYISTLLFINAWLFFDSGKETSKKLQVLERLLIDVNRRQSQEKQVSPDKEKISKLTIKNGYRTIILPVEDIICLLSEGPYVKVITETKAHLISMPLYELQAILPVGFLRVHRSHIVNTCFIKEAQSLLNGDYVLLLKNGSSLKASRTYRENLKIVLSMT